MQKAVLVFLFSVLLNEVFSKVSINKDHLTNKKAALAKQFNPQPPKWGELASFTKDAKNGQNKSKTLLNLLKVVTAKEIDVPDNTYIGNITIKNATVDNNNETKFTNTFTKVNNEPLTKDFNETTNEIKVANIANALNKANATVSKVKKKYLANETIGGKLASLKLNTTAEKTKLPEVIPPTMIPIFKPLQTNPRSTLQSISSDLIRQEQDMNLNKNFNSTNSNPFKKIVFQNVLSQNLEENRTNLEMDPKYLQNNVISNKNHLIHDNNGIVSHNNETNYIQNNPINNVVTQQSSILSANDVNSTPNDVTSYSLNPQNNNVYKENSVPTATNGFNPNSFPTQNAYKQEQNGFNPSNLPNQTPYKQEQNEYNPNGLSIQTPYINEQNAFNPNSLPGQTPYKLEQNGYNPHSLPDQAPHKREQNGYHPNGLLNQIQYKNEQNGFNPNNLPNQTPYKQEQNNFNVKNPKLDATQNLNNPANIYPNQPFNPIHHIQSEFNPMNPNDNGLNQNGIPGNPSINGFIPGNNIDQRGIVSNNVDNNQIEHQNTVKHNQHGLRSSNYEDKFNSDQSNSGAFNIIQNLINSRRLIENEFIQSTSNFTSKSTQGNVNIDQSGFNIPNINQFLKELINNRNRHENNLDPGVYGQGLNVLNNNVGENAGNKNIINKDRELNGLNPDNFVEGNKNNVNMDSNINSNNNIKQFSFEDLNGQIAKLLAKINSENNLQSANEKANNIPLNMQVTNKRVIPNDHKIPNTNSNVYQKDPKANSKPVATGFNIPYLKASDVLEDFYKTNVQIARPIVNPTTEATVSKLQCDKPIIIEHEDLEDESVAIVFKPKNISLLKFYGDLLKKITLTVLVPYHISKLTSQ